MGIVWLISRTKINSENKRTEILLEAIRNNADIDAGKLVKGLERPQEDKSSILQKYLLRGVIYTLLGIFFAFATVLFADQCSYEKYQYITLIVSIVTLAVGIGYIVTFSFVKKNMARMAEENSNKSETEE